MDKKNFYVKSHGLGNDYFVLAEDNITFELTDRAIVKLCDTHYGIGSDGILLKTISNNANFGLRIFNPDGSEAEKSGNGLRIFAKYLYDYGFATQKTFTIDTLGGIVTATVTKEVNNKAVEIQVDMGRATFTSHKIPVNANVDECLNFPLQIAGKQYEVNCVSVGNPHAVILKKELEIDEIKRVGHTIETHPIFPNRINVQFAKVINRKEAEILIWERGAGYTLASGSSSCAVACILNRLGLVDKEVAIHMPGGKLQIQLDEKYNIRMTGAVRQISEGVLHDEMLEDLL